MLIEDGIPVANMQDRQNARLMNMKPTGNGCRQGYAHVPMPRMTNTYMLAGHRDPRKFRPVKTESTRRISAAVRPTSLAIRVPVHRGLQNIVGALEGRDDRQRPTDLHRIL